MEGEGCRSFFCPFAKIFDHLWMCGLTLQEQKKTAELLGELSELKPIIWVINKGRLDWFGVDMLNAKMMLMQSSCV